jgi:hypothetical protein
MTSDSRSFSQCPWIEKVIQSGVNDDLFSITDWGNLEGKIIGGLRG